MKNLTFWSWLTTIGCLGVIDTSGWWWRHIRSGWRRRRRSRISARGTKIVTVLDTHGQFSKAISIGHPAVWGKRRHRSNENQISQRRADIWSHSSNYRLYPDRGVFSRILSWPRSKFLVVPHVQLINLFYCGNRWTCSSHMVVGCSILVSV